LHELRMGAGRYAAEQGEHGAQLVGFGTPVESGARGAQLGEGFGMLGHAGRGQRTQGRVVPMQSGTQRFRLPALYVSFHRFSGPSGGRVRYGEFLIMSIRILLADDHLLIRLGIRTVLERLGDYEIVGEAEDGNALHRMLMGLSPDLAIVDIAMPGLSGIESVLQARRDGATMPVIFLSALEGPDIVRLAIGAGSASYVHKDCVLEEIEAALSAVASGSRFISPRLAAGLPPVAPLLRGSARAGEITPRQMQILRLVAEGHTAKEIGRELGISHKTVEFHRAQLAERLGVRDIAGLTRYASEQGLLPMETVPASGRKKPTPE